MRFGCPSCSSSRRSSPVLIDTGWRATQQRLLMLAFPEIDWFGAYFGLMVSPNDECWHLADLVGLFFETDGYDPAEPKSVLYYYHHLIEDCLEPGFPSLIRSAECRRLEAMDLASLAAPLKRGRDEHFAGIVAYFQQVRQQPRRVDIRTASGRQVSMPSASCTTSSYIRRRSP
jgi:hypothetical protein